MPITAVLGVTASLGLLAAKDYQGALTHEGIDDRAYRISRHKGQAKVDWYSLVGGLIGAADGAILGKHGLRSIAASSLTGVALGVAVYGAETFALPKLEALAAEARGRAPQ